jgi:hypothetical protein
MKVVFSKDFIIRDAKFVYYHKSNQLLSVCFFLSQLSEPVIDAAVRHVFTFAGLQLYCPLVGSFNLL